MVVLRPDFGVEEQKVRELVQKLVGERLIKTMTVMGKKQLAYPIKKHSEGVYAVCEVAGEPMDIGAFEKQAKLGTDVLRFLITVKA